MSNYFFHHAKQDYASPLPSSGLSTSSGKIINDAINDFMAQDIMIPKSFNKEL